MSWPVEFAYRDKRHSSRRETDPAFVFRVVSSDLSLYVEPDIELTEIERKYFSALGQMSDELGIRILGFALDTDAEAGAVGTCTIHTQRKAEEGQFPLSQIDEHGRTSYTATPFHVDEFASQLADRDGIDQREAFRALVFLDAANEVGVDLFVTTREPLRGFGMTSQGCLVARPREALGVLGLFQRTKGSLLLALGVPTTLNKCFTDMWNSSAMLPELDGMFPRIDAGDDWEKTASLLRTIRDRLGRVMCARDSLILHHIASGRPVPGNAPEVLLEALALDISGIFDSMARIVNVLYGMGLPGQNCSFGNQAFFDRLDAGLARTAQEYQVGGLVRLVAQLRNTIHSEAMGFGAFSGPSRTLEPLVGVPLADSDRFMRSLNDFPEAQPFVFSPSGLLNPYIRTLPFVEWLVPKAVQGIRALIRECSWPGSANSEPWAWQHPDVREQLALLFSLDLPAVGTRR